MKQLRFGSSRFQIIVQDLEIWSPLADSQMLIFLEGPDWTLGGERHESLGVVVPSLIAFGRVGAARHWGAFADMSEIEEVIERVTSYVFAPGVKPSASWHWDAVSALHNYALSSIFDANLGVANAVAVRGVRTETIIVQLDDGAVSAYEVPNKSFDRAIDELAEWFEGLEETATPESRDGV